MKNNKKIKSTEGLYEKFCSPETQMSRLSNHSWSVARLIELSKKLKPFKIPLKHINSYYRYEKLTLREMVGHIKAVLDADLKYPIILDEDGEIMDGRHRLMKAILNGEKSIFAVRFKKNPTPCKINK
jgi:hypothetical protein